MWQIQKHLQTNHETAVINLIAVSNFRCMIIVYCKTCRIEHKPFRLGSKPVKQYCECKKSTWVSQRGDKYLENLPLRSIKQVKYQENI